VAAALVQKAKAHSNLGAQTLSLSLPSPATPGNTILSNCCSYSGYALNDTMDDNQGNGAYTKDVIQPADGRQHTTNINLFRKDAIAASGTFTVTYHMGAVNCNPNVYVAEFSGLAGGAPDANDSTMKLGGPELNYLIGPLTPTQAGDLFISCYDCAGAVTGQDCSISPNPDGFTLLDQEGDGSTYNVGGWAMLVAADSAAKQLTWTHAGGDGSNDTCASITAYKAGAVGPPPQQLRPDADLATAGWSTAPLWSKVDEAVAGGDVISAVSS
jgi:hypothetical protein